MADHEQEARHRVLAAHAAFTEACMRPRRSCERISSRTPGEVAVSCIITQFD